MLIIIRHHSLQTYPVNKDLGNKKYLMYIYMCISECIDLSKKKKPYKFTQFLQFQSFLTVSNLPRWINLHVMILSVRLNPKSRLSFYCKQTNKNPIQDEYNIHYLRKTVGGWDILGKILRNVL